MPQARLLAFMIGVTLILTSGTNALQVEFFKGDPTDTAAHSLLTAKGRSLTQDDHDVVCYLGCLTPPEDDLTTPPLPRLLFKTSTPAALLDCYRAAQQENLSHFAIFNVTACYGGSTPVLGWAPGDTCPLNCRPNGTAPFICGAVNRASVFSMGFCPRLGVPNTSSPSPSTVAAAQDCHANMSLSGVELRRFRLSARDTHDANVAACAGACAEDPQCFGYYYKNTYYCFLMSQVTDFKPYGTSLIACRTKYDRSQ